MHMLVRLSLIFLVLGSTSGKLFKKKKKSNKVSNTNKKLFRKNTGFIYSNSGNYIGVKVAKKSKDELNHAKAQAYCQSKYGTSLATVYDSTDQAEIDDLLEDSDWGNAVNKVWFGLKKRKDEQFEWELDDMDCSAKDQYTDSFHKTSNVLPGGVKNLLVDKLNVAVCGVLKRGSQSMLGMWGLNFCGMKREFICNAPSGKYGTSWDECPEDEELTLETDDEVTCDEDGALNIAFLLDESLDLDVANGWVEAIVESDVNDASFVSVFEFKGDDWLTYRQTVDFTDDKDAVFDALENNIKDTSYDDFNTIGTVNVDVLDKVMTVIHNGGAVNDADDESNVIVVFLDSSSIDILSNTVADYNKGVGVIFVIANGDEDASISFPNVVKLAGNRFSDWNGANVFAVDVPVTETEVVGMQSFIREKLCTSFTSSAWSVNGAVIGEELIVNGRPSFVGALVGLMVILLVVNVICLTISNCQKRNTKHRYQVVDVESSTELSS